MKHILSGRGRALLEQIAWSRVLLGFDFDGTLAPIVKDPELAVVRAQTRILLKQVAQRYPCVVISGRAQRDVSARVRGIGLIEVIGNHGIEPWAATDRLLQQVAAWQAPLARALVSVPGVVIENKLLSVAIHYRGSREKKKAHQAILSAATALGNVRTIGGKQVINLVPLGAPHKGTALEMARTTHGCDSAIFVGDDDTDEDAFTLEPPGGRLLTIRVGASRRSAAACCLRNQREIDALLRELLRLRAIEPTRRVGA